MGTSPITEVKQAIIDEKQRHINAMHAVGKRALELWHLVSDPDEKRVLDELRITTCQDAQRAIEECRELNKGPIPESSAIN